MSQATIKNHVAFIWTAADLLRGDDKQSEYGTVILPLVVFRLGCVLKPAKAGCSPNTAIVRRSCGLRPGSRCREWAELVGESGARSAERLLAPQSSDCRSASERSSRRQWRGTSM